MKTEKLTNNKALNEALVRVSQLGYEDIANILSRMPCECCTFGESCERERWEQDLNCPEYICTKLIDSEVDL